jgi:putative redox protein
MLVMSSSPFDSAISGKCVLVTETGMEPLQLLGRVGKTSFVIAGSRRDFCPESLNPYELLGAALGSCTAMVLRLRADRMGLALRRIQVCVSHHSGYPDAVARFEQTVFLEGSICEEEKRRLLQTARGGPIDSCLRGGAEICTTLGAGNHFAALAASSDYLRDIDQMAVVAGHGFCNAE